MNIYQKLQTVRCEVNKKCKKKTGQNKYAGFDYYQLEDFLPTANEEFLKVGLAPIFSIKQDAIILNDGEHQRTDKCVATLTIHDGDSFIKFESPVAEVKMGKDEKKNPIQELGAQHTYLKRYLYMNALELSEGDVVDATIGKETGDKKPTFTKLSAYQIAYTEQERAKIRNEHNVLDDKDLPRNVVDDYIKARKDVIKQKTEELSEDYTSKGVQFY